MLRKRERFHEYKEFLRFFSTYAKSRLLGWGIRFEKAKDVIVALLVVKRGKYSSSFLNTSFFLLVGAVFIAGPIIVENNPFIAGYFQEGEGVTQNVLVADVYAMSFQTDFSQKPRAAVEEYEVKPGDTLASIAEIFDITADTIKWQNNLTSDTIRPGQKLQILPVAGVAHKVKSGESIYSISKRYSVDPQKIVNFALAVGTTLIVPDGVPPKAVPRVRPGMRPQRASVIAGLSGSGRFIWPTTGNITQYPVYYHNALDIANKALPSVIASDGGTVIFAGCVGYGYGCHIIIDHGNGFSTLYAHLSRIDVGAGQAVGQGAAIGQVGSSGRSTGPHLHFEVRVGGVPKNPLSYLP